MRMPTKAKKAKGIPKSAPVTVPDKVLPSQGKVGVPQKPGQSSGNIQGGKSGPAVTSRDYEKNLVSKLVASQIVKNDSQKKKPSRKAPAGK